MKMLRDSYLLPVKNSGAPQFRLLMNLFFQCWLLCCERACRPASAIRAELSVAETRI